METLNISSVDSINNNVVKFTFEDFEKIKNNGFAYSIPPETLAIIQSLSDKVGAPEYIKTPQFNNKQYIPERRGDLNKKRRTNKYYEVSEEDWASTRNFKATILVKKEGMGAVIDQIRKHLNKITTKTYETLKNKIIDEIEMITDGVIEKNEGSIGTIDDEEFVNEINKIGEALFNIASGNSFYSNMYATLYKELMEKFAFMRTIFETNFDKFNTLFNDFSYCDPNKDYDEFCKNNKVNEKRRALSLFYINLMKLNLIDVNDILKITKQIKSNMLKSIEEANNKNIVDEMSEVLYIILVNGVDHLKTLEKEWTDLKQFVKNISDFKTTNYPSITNKTIFKFMDIFETF